MTATSPPGLVGEAVLVFSSRGVRRRSRGQQKRRRQSRVATIAVALPSGSSDNDGAGGEDRREVRPGDEEHDGDEAVRAGGEV